MIKLLCIPPCCTFYIAGYRFFLSFSPGIGRKKCTFAGKQKALVEHADMVINNITGKKTYRTQVIPGTNSLRMTHGSPPTDETL